MQRITRWVRAGGYVDDAGLGRKNINRMDTVGGQLRLVCACPRRLVPDLKVSMVRRRDERNRVKRVIRPNAQDSVTSGP